MVEISVVSLRPLVGPLVELTILTCGLWASDLPACEIVKLRPAMAIVPVRAWLPLLGSTVKPTVPLPLPGLELVMLIQASPLALTLAAHGHPFGAVTPTLPAPPSALTFTLAGESE